MEKVRQETGKEHIYRAALVTDSDCITLFLAVNTEEALLVQSVIFPMNGITLMGQAVS